MSEREHPIKQYNAVTYLRDFIQTALILTPEEETILEKISLNSVKNTIILDTPKVINIPPNIRAINKQFKKQGLKMCNYCGETKPIEDFYRRFGLCSSCYLYLKKKRRDIKNGIHYN